MRYREAVELARKIANRRNQWYNVVYVPEYNWYDVETVKDRQAFVFASDIVVATIEPS